MKVETFGIAGYKTLIGAFTVLLGQRASDVVDKKEQQPCENFPQKLVKDVHVPLRFGP